MKQQTGRSMVEMLAVVMIIGILTVGAVAGLNQAMDKYRVGKMHTDILSADSELVNLYAWQRKYPGGEIEATDLCDNEIFPDGCSCKDDSSPCKSWNAPQNPYGGVYKVKTNSDDNTKTISATGLSSGVCNDLVVQEWGPNLAGNPSCNDDTFSITFY